MKSRTITYQIFPDDAELFAFRQRLVVVLGDLLGLGQTSFVQKLETSGFEAR
jgi:hypothetical protein